jgi:hypothetical protein
MSVRSFSARLFAPEERRYDPGPVDDTYDWLFFGISRHRARDMDTSGGAIPPACDFGRPMLAPRNAAQRLTDEMNLTLTNGAQGRNRTTDTRIFSSLHQSPALACQHPCAFKPLMSLAAAAEPGPALSHCRPPIWYYPSTTLQ